MLPSRSEWKGHEGFTIYLLKGAVDFEQKMKHIRDHSMESFHKKNLSDAAVDLLQYK